jgi:dethiobiotin synthase
MLRGVFVTGTDTGIGKTVVSAALMHRYRRPAPHAHSPRIRYWKPVQTGAAVDDDTEEVRRLGNCSEDELLKRGLRFAQPVSPHLAARLNGTTIRLAELAEIAGSQPSRDRWIVEGAGGVLVPLTGTELIADLIRLLGLPSVIVARAGLGTINHSLLTIDALRHRALPVLGVVMVGKRNPENRAAIEAYGRVPVLGELPPCDPLTPGALGQWASTDLDPAGRLEECFNERS